MRSYKAYSPASKDSISSKFGSKRQSIVESQKQKYGTTVNSSSPIKKIGIGISKELDRLNASSKKKITKTTKVIEIERNYDLSEGQSTLPINSYTNSRMSTISTPVQNKAKYDRPQSNLNNNSAPRQKSANKFRPKSGNRYANTESRQNEKEDVKGSTHKRVPVKQIIPECRNQNLGKKTYGNPYMNTDEDMPQFSGQHKRAQTAINVADLTQTQKFQNDEPLISKVKQNRGYQPKKREVKVQMTNPIPDRKKRVNIIFDQFNESKTFTKSSDGDDSESTFDIYGKNSSKIDESQSVLSDEQKQPRPSTMTGLSNQQVKRGRQTTAVVAEIGQHYDCNDPNAHTPRQKIVKQASSPKKAKRIIGSNKGNILNKKSVSKVLDKVRRVSKILEASELGSLAKNRRQSRRLSRQTNLNPLKQKRSYNTVDSPERGANMKRRVTLMGEAELMYGIKQIEEELQNRREEEAQEQNQLEQIIETEDQLEQIVETEESLLNNQELNYRQSIELQDFEQIEQQIFATFEKPQAEIKDGKSEIAIDILGDLQNEHFQEEFYSSDDEKNYMLDLQKKRQFEGISPIPNFSKQAKELKQNVFKRSSKKLQENKIREAQEKEVTLKDISFVLAKQLLATNPDFQPYDYESHRFNIETDINNTVRSHEIDPITFRSRQIRTEPVVEMPQPVQPLGLDLNLFNKLELEVKKEGQLQQDLQVMVYTDILDKQIAKERHDNTRNYDLKKLKITIGDLKPKPDTHNKNHDFKTVNLDVYKQKIKTRPTITVIALRPQDVTKEEKFYYKIPHV